MAFAKGWLNTLTGNTGKDKAIAAAAAQESIEPPPPPPSPTYSPPNTPQAPSKATNPVYGGAAGGFTSTILTGPQGLVGKPKTAKKSLLGG